LPQHLAGLGIHDQPMFGAGINGGLSRNDKGDKEGQAKWEKAAKHNVSESY
jgi:hypothetical protein